MGGLLYNKNDFPLDPGPKKITVSTQYFKK